MLGGACPGFTRGVGLRGVRAGAASSERRGVVLHERRARRLGAATSVLGVAGLLFFIGSSHSRGGCAGVDSYCGGRVLPEREACRLEALWSLLGAAGLFLLYRVVSPRGGMRRGGIQL
jgi:hypothetical protein